MQMRKLIPQQVVASILIESRRRCCFCFFWDGDLTQKEGQITHVDRDHENNAQENLAFLCLKHHNEYDRKQLQAKNYTPEELQHAKKQLVEHMTHSGRSIAVVTLELNRSFDTFSDHDQDSVLSLVRDALNGPAELRIRSRQPGSVRLTLELSSSDTEKLVDAFATGKLAACDAIGITIDSFKNPVRDMSLDTFWEDGVCKHAFSKQQIEDVVRTPDREQLLFPKQSVSTEQPGVALFVKQFCKSNTDNCYSALVMAARTENTTFIHTAVRVYATDVEHSPDWPPLEVLRAFLNNFGYATDYGLLGKTLLLLAKHVNVPPNVVTPPQLLQYLSRVLPDRAAANDPTEHFTFAHRSVLGGQAFISIAFTLITRRYARCLVSHGINLPRCFLSARPYSS